MFNCEAVKGTKRAAITVEMAIGWGLAIVVLMVTLGLFNVNLGTMISNSGIQNMFNNTQKTTYGKQAFDPTQNPIVGISSQVNVQVLAEQGLNTLPEFINAAQTNVDIYNKTNPQTQAQVEDLAKCLTILKMTGGASAVQQYNSLATKYGIGINMQNGYYITQVQTNNITGLTINEQFVYNSESKILNSETTKLAAAQEIQKAKYAPITSQ